MFSLIEKMFVLQVSTQVLQVWKSLHGQYGKFDSSQYIVHSSEMTAG